jgi:hypothetical protein
MKITRWGKRQAKCSTHNPISSMSTLFLHYSASDGSGIDKKGEPVETMHNLQNYHMDNNGWCDIGYSYVVIQPRGIFKRALVFEGRGFRNVPSSQEGHNTGNVSVCVVADSNDKIKRSTVRAIRQIIRRCPATKVRGHRDVNSTSCPGDRLYSKVPTLDKESRKPKVGMLP